MAEKKLYWRRDDGSLREMWHCFVRVGTDFASLCGAFHRSHSDGRAINRPAQHLRCGACDENEMHRRGRRES